jgi:hypothetical protein
MFRGASNLAEPIIQSMVRPERDRVRVDRFRCCIRLAGGSPAAVSAGAPRSRLRARGEIRASERSVESPVRAGGSGTRGAKLRAECESVNFAAP